MIKLSKMNCERGAPMGRTATHHTGLTDPLFEVERVPLIDGGYDAGAAYWGYGERLWVADFTTPLTSTTIVHYFIRADDRESAMAQVLKDYPSAKFKPETGSVIEQTIEFLANWIETENTEGDDDDTQLELEDLESELRRIKNGS